MMDDINNFNDNLIKDLCITKESSSLGTTSLDINLQKIKYISDKNNIQSILIINPTALGDVILSFGLVGNLIKNGFDVYYLVAEQYKNVILKIGLPPNRILTFSKNYYYETDVNKKTDEIKKIIFKINNLNIELLINLHSSTYSAKLSALLRIKNKCGNIYDYKKGKIIFNGDLSNYYKYIFSYLFRKGSPIYLSVNHFYHYTAGLYNIYKPEIVLENIDVNFDRPTIAIVPGASQSSKRWSPEKFAKLINVISKKYNYDFLLILSEQEKEIGKHITDNIEKPETETALKIFYKEFSFDNIFEIISKCKLMISNDTGPVHIANCVNVPVVTLFSSSHGVVNDGNNIILYPDIDCLGCLKDICDKQKKCIDIIESETVGYIVDKIIENNFKIDKSLVLKFDCIQNNINIYRPQYYKELNDIQLKFNMDLNKYSDEYLPDDLFDIFYLNSLNVINKNLDRIETFDTEKLYYNEKDFFKSLIEIFVNKVQNKKILAEQLNEAKNKIEILMVEFSYIKIYLQKLKNVKNPETEKNYIETIIRNFNSFENQVKPIKFNRYLIVLDILLYNLDDLFNPKTISRFKKLYYIKFHIINFFLKNLESSLEYISNI